MQQSKRLFGRAFLVTGVFATLFIITEMVLQSFGKSICQTEGCNLVAQYTRFGDISILLFGLVTFSLLSLLSYLALYKNRNRLEWYINIILIVSLAAEGFFAGYQAFRLSAACIFCLITMGFVLVLAVLRLLYGEKEMLSGFLAFAGVFALFYMVLPVGSVDRLPDDELILFYSKDCRYCTEVIKELNANNLKVTHLPVGKYSAFLQGMGIEHVPTLYVNGRNQKIYLTGKEAIDRYLESRKNPQPQKNISPTVNKMVKPSATEKNKAQKKTEAPSAAGPDDLKSLLIPNDNQFNPIGKPDDPGMCPGTEKCD
jgi:uncharacterized membrane protein